MRKKKIWHRGNPAGFSVDTAINGNAGIVVQLEVNHFY